MENASKKGISTRMRNIMNAYIGKKYNFSCYGFRWTTEIVGLMGCSGYFITKVNDGEKEWRSNVSYGEITNGLKKGIYKEVA